MGYNRFGAVYTDIVALYPGSVAADFGGQTTIEAALDMAVDMVAGSLSSQAFVAITEPTFLMAVRCASQGQTTFTLPLVPIISGSFHLWAASPRLFQIRPRLLNDAQPIQGDTQVYSGGYGIAAPQLEKDRSTYTVNLTTGLVTLNTALNLDDQVFMSYQLDTSAATYALPSLARLAIRGAAAELGARIYSDGQQEWGLVTRYTDTWNNSIKALRASELIPDEIRFLRWWSEIDRASPQGGGIRFSRG